MKGVCCGAEPDTVLHHCFGLIWNRLLETQHFSSLKDIFLYAGRGTGGKGFFFVKHFHFIWKISYT